MLSSPRYKNNSKERRPAPLDFVWFNISLKGAHLGYGHCGDLHLESPKTKLSASTHLWYAWTANVCLRKRVQP